MINTPGEILFKSGGYQPFLEHAENRGKAQEQINASGEWMRALLEGSSDMVQVLDEKGTIRYVSPSMERILGYDPRLPLGDSAFKIVHPDDQGVLQIKFAELFKDPEKPLKVICRVRHKNGSWRHIEAWAKNHLANPAINGIVLNIRDITEHIEAKVQLEASEERLAEQNKLLQQKNMALRELMSQVEVEKKKTREQIQANIDQLVLPVLSRLKVRCGGADRVYVDILEENLREITIGFGLELSRKMHHLTQKEIELCSMIKQGLTSKEIGALLSISPRTVETHRTHIRKKLGIAGPEVNMTTYLKSEMQQLSPPCPALGT
jgi:PAS domain S-box-containing protein